MLTTVGFTLVSVFPVLLDLDSQAATFPYRAALRSLTMGGFVGWLLLLVRVFMDTVIDPPPGGFGVLVVARTLGRRDAAVQA